MRRLEDHNTDTSHHPLDLLTIQELNTIRTILNSHMLFTSTSSYVLHRVELQEPDKSLVLVGSELAQRPPVTALELVANGEHQVCRRIGKQCGDNQKTTQNNGS
ncbi:hypothetical protein ACFX11_000682 [Malus domestica]